MRNHFQVLITTIIFLIASALINNSNAASEPDTLHALSNPKNQPALIQALEDAQVSAIEKAAQSVVLIEVQKSIQEKRARTNSVFSSGSGFIVTDEGYILTNKHVVDPSGKIDIRKSIESQSSMYYYTVTFIDGQKSGAKLVSMNQFTDLAVLSLDSPPSNLVPSELGDSSRVRAGQFAYAIGSPHGLENSVSAGIVSNPEQKLDNFKYHPVLQTDAALNPGNSGGPLINIRGEVIGINTLIFSTVGQNSGIGFAIPVKVAKEYLEVVLRQGKGDGWIGITVQKLDNEMRFYMTLPKESLPDGLSNLYISEVDPKGPAYGLLKVNDVIVRVDGNIIATASDFNRFIFNAGSKKKIKLEVFRNNQFQEIIVVTDIAKKTEDE